MGKENERYPRLKERLRKKPPEGRVERVHEFTTDLALGFEEGVWAPRVRMVLSHGEISSWELTDKSNHNSGLSLLHMMKEKWTLILCQTFMLCTPLVTWFLIQHFITCCLRKPYSLQMHLPHFKRSLFLTNATIVASSRYCSTHESDTKRTQHLLWTSIYCQVMSGTRNWKRKSRTAMHSFVCLHRARCVQSMYGRKLIGHCRITKQRTG